MKTATWSLLLIAVAATGCLSPDFLNPKSAKKIAETPPAAVPPARYVSPVTADMVDPANAHQKVKALLEEIDRDGQGEVRQ